MDRVIKFRAWHTVNKAMYDHKSIPILLKNLNDDNVWKYMQYTGIDDWTGVPIYEGDIILRVDTDWASNSNPNITLDHYLRNISTVCVVKYNTNYAVFEAYYKGLYDDWSTSVSLFVKPYGRLEVIGNIYQNQELLIS